MAGFVLNVLYLTGLKPKQTEEQYGVYNHA